MTGAHNESGDDHGIGSSTWLQPVDLSQEYVTVYGLYYTDTTNNRTEMSAVINGILHADDGNIVLHPLINVVTDSGYVQKGYMDPAYLDRWAVNGWKTSTKKPVKNRVF